MDRCDSLLFVVVKAIETDEFVVFVGLFVLVYVEDLDHAVPGDG